GALHDARVARGRGFAERRVHLRARGVEARGGVHGAELRVVQQVVDLPPALESLRAAGGEVLEDREIPVVDAGQLEDGARSVAVVAAARRARERGYVQPAARLARHPIARAARRIAGEHGAHGAHAAADVAA